MAFSGMPDIPWISVAELSRPGRAFGTLEVKGTKDTPRFNLNIVCDFRMTEQATEGSKLLAACGAFEVTSYLMRD